MSSTAGIAVVGVAVELPGGVSTEINLDSSTFFQFLLNKGEAYEKIPLERLNVQGVKGAGLGQIVTDTGSFLKHIGDFDPVEFGITSKDVRGMPVATRKLIELAFLALLDSGAHYRGQNVGCYMAGVAHDVQALSGYDINEMRGAFTGAPSSLANRVSYHLDLRGPSIPIDTACSSTLVATHLGVQALRNGDCDLAVVGGAQINHRFAEWAVYSQGGILSPDGKCKPFDAAANGFGRAEGIVAIVLKPFEAALRDHDTIYGTILGTGLSSSGSLAPANAPVALAQQDAMERAFTMAKRLPQEVDFIELHATGTSQGDPTEANWVGDKFHRDDELVIGSVKGNLGHLEIAAFLASLCKVLWSFQTGFIPPNVNLSHPNPAIRWREYRLRVPLEAERLSCRSPSGRSLVALTSSGISGVNGHCVVEGPPPARTKDSLWLPGANVPSLIIAAGLTPRSASAVAGSMDDLVRKHDPIHLARIYGRRSRSLTWRSFSMCTEAGLSHFSEPLLSPKTPPALVFVFSGQGPQHFAMGRELFVSCSVFRTTVLELDTVHLEVTGYSLIKRYGLFDNASGKEDELGDIWPITVTLPAIAILQIALLDTLASIGLKPDVVVGHSAGETALLYAAGCAPKAMVVEIAIARGRAMSSVEGVGGSMAALSCSAQEAKVFIAEVFKEMGPGKLDIGCYNSAGSVTLSGAEHLIDLAVEKANGVGIFAKRLRTGVPVHSTMMGTCEMEFWDSVSDVFARYKAVSPKVTTYSTVTGSLFDSAFDTQYFWNGTVGPVLFFQAMQAIAATYSVATYIEIGPHPVLSSYISAIAGNGASVTAPLKRPKRPNSSIEVSSLMESLGRIVIAGHNCVDFDVLFSQPSSGYSLQHLLRYPFSKKKIPYVAPTAMTDRHQQHRLGPLNFPQLEINSKTHPVFAQHVIKHEPIMPASGYLEMIFEFGAKQLWNVTLVSMLSLSSKRAIPCHVKLDGCRWSVLSASPAVQHGVWPQCYDRVHATGYISTDEANTSNETPLPLEDIFKRLSPVETKNFYRDFSTSFAQYGPMYQRVISCAKGTSPTGQDEVLVQLRGTDEDLPDISQYRVHPAIIDAAIHVCVHPLMTGQKGGSRYYLPSKIGFLKIYPELERSGFPKLLFSHGIITKCTMQTLVYDFSVTDTDGNRLLTVESLEIALHGNQAKQTTGSYNVISQPYEPVVESTPPRTAEALPSVVVHYVRGNEMEIQRAISELDPLKPTAVWFHATAGVDGDASSGFTRSFRKEYSVWKVYAVVFDPVWSLTEQRTTLAKLHEDAPTEVELYIDDTGLISIPRIVPLPSATSQEQFDPCRPWVYEAPHFVHVQLEDYDVPPDHVLVNVAGILTHSEQLRLWSFVGSIEGHSGWVGGISCAPLSNTVVAHRLLLTQLHGDDLNTEICNRTFPDFLASVVVGLALRQNGLSSETVHGRKVLVCAEDDFGSRIVELCARLGTQVAVLPTHPTVSALRQLSVERPDLVIIPDAGSDYDEVFKDLLPSWVKPYYWGDAATGVSHTLTNNPAAIGRILTSLSQQDPLMKYLPPLAATQANAPEVVECRFKTFSAHKTYVLIGGIGSLGLEIASWMYKEGARHIVLTSRAGRDTALSASRSLHLRLACLEAAPGLSLRLDAADASSVTDMARVMSGLSKPLGGCMIVSVVLRDMTFSMQTQESFEATFPSKTGAFEALEKTCDIGCLDFLITFSSVSALFGNAGQTNYASANTALAGMTRKYRNAFCLVVPAIVDSDIAFADDARAARMSHLVKWGMTSLDLCEYIGDGIRRLKDGPIWQYLPNVDWIAVREYMGPSKMYEHLVPAESDIAHGPGSEAPASLEQIICKVLDVAPEDLTDNVPLTAYGLDSLSAASLSYAIAPILRVTQIQLLADVTLRDLQQRRLDQE